MLNRIFFRGNGKLYKLIWIPLIYYVAFEGTIFNWVGIISSSLSSCVVGVSRNILPSAGRSCSFGLNGLNPEQINDKGLRPSLDFVDTWNACFDSKPVYLQSD